MQQITSIMRSFLSSLGLIRPSASMQESLNKIARRADERKEAMARLESHFPAVTQEQELIVRLSLESLSVKLRTGELSSLAVMQAFFAKAIQVTKKTNAVTEFLESALEEAKNMDEIPLEDRGPLHGVPFSVKENLTIKGHDATFGFPRLLEIPAQEDSSIVWMFRQLGAIPFCRTNVPQSGASFDCSNPIYGVTTNFLDPKRSPGGSSGGEGALIGGGGSIIGIGTDIGGSVRTPAHFNGVVGFKPTTGRLPRNGFYPSGMVGVHQTVGLMGKSGANIEFAMKLLIQKSLANQLLTDFQFVPLPWDEGKRLSDRKLKIGWFDFDGYLEVTPGMKRAVMEAREALQAKGHELVPFRPLGLDKIFELCHAFFDADGGAALIKAVEHQPLDYQSIGFKVMMMRIPLLVRKLLSPIVALVSEANAMHMTSESKSCNPDLLRQLEISRLDMLVKLKKDWVDKGVDVALCPAFAFPAARLGYPAYLLSSCSYGIVYNCLEFPSGVVPITKENEMDQANLEKMYPGYETDWQYGWIKDSTRGAIGMPLSVQVVGLPWQEELVLRVMTELEASVVT